MKEAITQVKVIIEGAWSLPKAHQPEGELSTFCPGRHHNGKIAGEGPQSLLIRDFLTLRKHAKVLCRSVTSEFCIFVKMPSLCHI